MRRLLTLQRIRDRIVYFLGVEGVPGLALSHPSLYEASLAAPSISTVTEYSRDGRRVCILARQLSNELQMSFLSSVLHLFPSLIHIELIGFLGLSSRVYDFFKHCAARKISVHVQTLSISRLPCRIPRDLCLSVDELTAGSSNVTCIFNGHRIRTTIFCCRTPYWRAFAAANPALFELDTLTDDAFIDLSPADVSRSWVCVEESTPLIDAVSKGESPEVINDLVKQWSRCVNGQNDTALAIAAQAGKAELVAALIPFEAGIRGPRHGSTALIAATVRGHADCVSLLIPYEAGIYDGTGSTALMAAATCGHEGMFAAVRGHVKCVSLLAPFEARVRDKEGITALMMAAELGDAEIVSLLVDKEARMVDDNGNTALMYAVVGMMHHSHFHSALSVSLLADREAGMKDSDGDTALMRALERLYRYPTTVPAAVSQSCLTIVELLAPMEAAVAKSNGETPLMVAVSHDLSECIPLLISAGAGRADREA
jgi:ankyrin repeat protein